MAVMFHLLICLFSLFSRRVQLNEAQDEIMKKKELLEDLQPDNTQTCESRIVLLCCT